MHITNLNLVMYLRKSRADQEAEARGEGETLSKHRRILHEFVKQYNHNIIRTFEEVLSGERIIDRPEMQKLLRVVQDGYCDGTKIDGVLCIDSDRLGRGDMIDQGIIAATFKDANVYFVTPRKIYDPENEFDEEYFEFESFFARRELKVINRRLQRGRRNSASEGKHVAAKPPYGYNRPENLTLTPDPETAHVVKLIFDLYVNERVGHGEIAKRLTDANIKSPSGKDIWDKTMVSRILKNEVYIGNIIWGVGQWRKGNDGGYKFKPHDRSKWVIKEGSHEPLIDPETFDKVKEISKQRPFPGRWDKNITNPLAGLLFCAYCNRAMRRRPGRGGRRDRLLCQTYKCPNKSAIFEVVEARFVETLKLFIAGLDVETEQPRAQSGSMQEILKKKISKFQVEIDTLKKQSNNIHDLLEQGVYTIEKFIERNTEIDNRITQTKLDLKITEDELTKIEKQSLLKNRFVPRIVNVLDSYENLCTKDKNDLLKEIVERAVFTKDTIGPKMIDDFVLEVYLHQ